MPKDLDRSKNLSGDSQRLDQDGSSRVGFRLWIALVIVLGAIALAVWRHAG